MGIKKASAIPAVLALCLTALPGCSLRDDTPTPAGPGTTTMRGTVTLTGTCWSYFDQQEVEIEVFSINTTTKTLVPWGTPYYWTGNQKSDHEIDLPSTGQISIEVRVELTAASPNPACCPRDKPTVVLKKVSPLDTPHSSYLVELVKTFCKA